MCVCVCVCVCVGGRGVYVCLHGCVFVAGVRGCMDVGVKKYRMCAIVYHFYSA